ncbi:MAG: nucleotidyltransferase family protein, partial [Planctomycetes bacterium]|nr:nucleotidyltransferase family protein [Planctomycetota bacterium]
MASRKIISRAKEEDEFATWNKFAEFMQYFISAQVKGDGPDLLLWCKNNYSLLNQWRLSSYVSGILLEHGLTLTQLPAELMNQFLHQQYRFEILEREALALLRFCQHHKIKVMPLKGLWMAWRLLPHAAMRSFGDMDVWVDKEAQGVLESYLLEQGYHKTSSAKLGQKYHFHSSYYRLVNSIPVVFEVHWALSPSRLESMPWQSIWKN